MPQPITSSTTVAHATRPSRCQHIGNMAARCLSAPFSLIAAPFKWLGRNAPKGCFSWPINLLSVPVQAAATPVLKSLFKAAVSDAKPIDYSKYETVQGESAHLNSVVSLTNKTHLAHRIVKAGITDGLCTVEGNPTPQMIQLYERYAFGGYSMIIGPDTTVDRRCRLPGTTGHTPIFDPKSHRKSFEDLAKAMKKGGALAILQLTHPGHVVPFGDPAYAPSVYLANNPRSGLSQYTYQLKIEEINQILEMFLSSARQAEEWGFDGIQIVASNSYLPSVFLNPHINTRIDKWGKNSFVFTLVETLLKQRKNERFVVGLKVNSADFQMAQMKVDQALSLVEQISALKPDFIEIGGGNCERAMYSYQNSQKPKNTDTKNDSHTTNQMQSTSQRESFFNDFATMVLSGKSIKIPVMATGEWRSLQAMNRASQQYSQLLIGLGRPTCLDPEVGKKLLQAQISLIPNWFQQYLPPFVAKALKDNPAEAGKMAFGVEMMWHSLAVASTAFGKKIPEVERIFEKPEHALAARVHMLIRAVTRRDFLLSYFREHPLASSTDKKKDK